MRVSVYECLSRAITTELDSRRLLLESCPEPQSIQITVKFTPGGQVRRIIFSVLCEHNGRTKYLTGT